MRISTKKKKHGDFVFREPTNRSSCSLVNRQWKWSLRLMLLLTWTLTFPSSSVVFLGQQQSRSVHRCSWSSCVAEKLRAAPARETQNLLATTARQRGREVKVLSDLWSEGSGVQWLGWAGGSPEQNNNAGSSKTQVPLIASLKTCGDPSIRGNTAVGKVYFVFFKQVPSGEYHFFPHRMCACGKTCFFLRWTNLIIFLSILNLGGNKSKVKPERRFTALWRQPVQSLRDGSQEQRKVEIGTEWVSKWGFLQMVWIKLRWSELKSITCNLKSPD